LTKVAPSMYNDNANEQSAGRFVFVPPEGYNLSCRQSASLCVGLTSCCSLAMAANTHRRRFVMDEVWKDVPGFPGYKVSNFGNVQSCRGRKRIPGLKGSRGILTDKWHKLKGYVRKTKYTYFVLYKDSQPFTKSAHHLVLETFIGPRPDGYCACHNDGNPLNNCLTNLRWDTPRSNYDDAVKHGSLRGANNGRAKLAENDVKRIRELCNQGVSSTELGKEFGVDPSQIRKVARRKAWKHIK
jgi:hypothetical protein